MPSGITHILLMKELYNRLPFNNLKMLIGEGRDFIQVGALGPDLPYASVADSDFVFSIQSDLADKFHYIKTNEIPLKAFVQLKNNKDKMSDKSLTYHFSFFLGYLAHVIADGIIHPFVRDKVGNYSQNQTEHRKLEMKLDVLLFHYLTRSSGHPIEFNNSNVHEELTNFDPKVYPEVTDIMDLFSRLIKEVYSDEYSPDQILDWISGMHRMFGMAEGRHWFIYENIPIIKDYLFKDYDDIINDSQNIILNKPIDRIQNFLKVPQIHFYEDIIPHFFSVFIPIAEKAYDYIFSNGPALTENIITEIDLDTGRALSVNNDLNYIPSFWS